VTEHQNRIAIVLPDLNGGGTERVNLELAREFIALGIAVDFVVLKRRGDLLNEVEQLTSVTNLDVPGIRHALLPLRRYIDRVRPDALLISMWPLTAVGILAARLSGHIPRIVVAEHVDFRAGSRESSASRWAMRHAGRWLYSWADHVVCVSDGARHALAAETGFAAERIAVIYNPVRPPTTVGPAADGALASWWRAAPYPILAVGRLMEQKDHQTLLQAFAVVAEQMDARLIILGEGPERGRLERIVAELGLNDRVRLPGYRPDVPAYLSQAALFVLSSRWEGLGNVLIEAMLQGVPVVSTDCPSGPAELLDGGTYGPLVPLGDSAALAEAMLATLARPPDAAKLIEAGMAYAPRTAANAYLSLLIPLRCESSRA
jgi:glycosyltransferase involved in cell wall biosynthesis